jgi:hypothetical protein
VALLDIPFVTMLNIKNSATDDNAIMNEGVNLEALISNCDAEGIDTNEP